MRKIRVIHVNYAFPTGGLEKGIATIIRNSSEKFEHILMCLTTSGESTKLLPANTRILELHKPPGNSRAFLVTLIRTFKSLRPAIVHTRNWAGTDAILAARLAGIRSIVHGEHGWQVVDLRGANMKRILVRRMLSLWVREFTCVSEHMRQWLIQQVRIRRPVTQIYNGVDTERFCPGTAGVAIRRECQIPEDAFVIGVIARLAPVKNHPMLFDAFAQVKQQRPDAYLFVVGDGPERDRLNRLAGDGIIFLGNRLDVAEIFQALDVFTLPSLNEGISNTILEAMATALPTVVTNVGGNPELVKHGQTGVLVPSEDAAAMSKALLDYAEHPDLGRRHGQYGRTQVIQQFSVQKMVASYEAVYKRAVPFMNS